MKVCPHCAEELPDEATACSECGKDPAAVPAWAERRRPDPGSARRLDDVFGPDGVLPTSDRVPAPYERLEEPSGAMGVPSKVWMSIILAFGWRVVPVTFLPLPWGSTLMALGYLAGLILGIGGRREVRPSDRLGQILATVAIGFNAINLIWTIVGVLGIGLALRG